MQDKSVEKQRIPVLLYHRIDVESETTWRPFCVSPEDFTKQMEWLSREGFQTIDLHHMLNYYRYGHPVPMNAIVITFDDGYYCNYSRAFSIMGAHGFTGTIFLAANLLRPNSPQPRAGRNSFMAWNEIHEMQRAGWSFQSHGLDHRPMTALSPEMVWREIVDSKKLITDRLGKAVDFFCYPFGQFNEVVKARVQEAGYRGACGGPPFYEKGPVSDFAIGRSEILWGDSFAEFRFKVRHGLGYFYFAKRQLGKIKRALFRSPQLG